LIATELMSAAALLAAVILVVPDAVSKAYAMMSIIANVVPGLMLTGDIKLLNAGLENGRSNLKFKTVGSAAVNIPLGLGGLMLFEHGLQWVLAVSFVALTTLGATAQTFSSVWFYAQTDRSLLMKGKIAAAAIKVMFAAAAVGLAEFTLALIGVTLGSIAEFGLNCGALPWHAAPRATSRRHVVSPLGVAYGVSRVVSAGIRLGLSQFFGALIASFLMIEQLVGGLNSLIEKYFARSTRWLTTSRVLKVAYLAGVAAAAPTLASLNLSPSDDTALAWLAVIACAGLLPLSEMYRALQRRGPSFVAVGSIVVSLTCGLLLAAAWVADRLGWAALATYILLPGCTFVFYWVASIDAGHNTQRPTPR
jgi:hypothetical protein